MQNEFQGHSLFNDVENAVLKSENRAQVLLNMYEMSVIDPSLQAQGAALMVGYFNCIPPHERGPVYGLFQEKLLKRGWTANKEPTVAS